MCQKIPRLGGLAFYPAILIAYWVMRGLLSLFDFHLVGLPVEEMLFFFAGITIVYYIGIADDVIGLSYKSKFIYQFLAAILLVLPLNYISDWQGIFGVYHIPACIGIPFTVVLIVALINSFNLIEHDILGSTEWIMHSHRQYLFGPTGNLCLRCFGGFFLLQRLRAPNEDIYG